MNFLREKLKSADIELYNAIEASWKYAVEKIYPSIPVDMDSQSLNSLPHIINIERYVEEILFPCGDIFNEEAEVYISPQELYVLLASVHFHDIGRIKKKNGHAVASGEIIKSRRAELKIPSEDLANAIAEICEYHDREISDKKSETLTKDSSFHSKAKKLDASDDSKNKDLQPILLDNGIIRVRELASFLVLVDNMDGTFNRLIPSFLVENKYKSTLATYRNMCRGVIVEKNARAIFQSINKLESKPEKAEQQYELVLNSNLQNKDPSEISIKLDERLVYYNDVLNHQLGKKNINHELETESRKLINEIISGIFSLYNGKRKRIRGLIEKIEQNDYIKKILNKRKSNIFEENISLSLIKAGIFWCKKLDINLEWDRNALIASILSNIRENADDLRNRCKHIARLGIRINAWLLYQNGHLYNFLGEETYEPIFSRKYLSNIAKYMWHLSSKIFGATSFSYETLASVIGDADIIRVKIAVKRLSILAQNVPGNIILFDNQKWSWADGKHEEIEQLIKHEIGVPNPFPIPKSK